ncbi:hypothetical protein FPF71_07040 [Algibacter amylolyticus]|uniref:LapA family protein n=1 Tax=Algibacter amylolyticus TaxID=1608400 RepID=A0A5M7BBF9_9FLAO|nr:hypothetical protein [Algibacter amylolyticus]KAA5825658.1 hypothetical protein F2B50_07040 [Algibacter amylolyticus]MBB5268112.1 hypothetical protein [Algibacter amylolyticus]TSJ79956.1 hypothetical protein FPF71_07040 [Algibacter amylolyticus]
MLLKIKLTNFAAFSLISESSIVMLLVVITVFFGILLLLGVRKSYKLKKENERLEAMSTRSSENTDDSYKDFTDGHMYGGN